MKIKDFLERTSIRDFDKNPMSQKDIEVITDVINNAPTSTNAQQFSAIIITNQQDKDWFSKNNWNQQHLSDAAALILFVADRHRARYSLPKYANDNVAIHEVYRGVVDATIGATYAQDALITMGYGVTMVGGVMAYSDAIEERFDLPEDVQVIVALSIGKSIKVSEFKPKMNKVFIDKYDAEKSIEELKSYNKIMIEYYRDRGQENDFINNQANMLKPDGPERMIKPFTVGGKNFQKHIEIAKKNKA